MADVELSKRVPTDRVPFEVRERLDGDDYLIGFSWNHRADDGQGAWVMSLFDIIGNPLVRSRKLVIDTDLLGKYRYLPRMPQGRFEVLASENPDINPQKDDLNTRISVFYRGVGGSSA